MKLRISGIIIISYLFICLSGFFSRRPPWLDEIYLINNLKELRPWELFGPLRYGQGFPRAYLFIIHNLSSVFNYNVLSLRILPFIFMLTGFGIWLEIFRKARGRGDGYLLFMLCWCGSVYMTYYASEFKHYSADVFAAGVFTYFILKQKESSGLPCLKAGIILQYLFLPLLVLFSYTAYFFILIVAWNLLLLCLRYKRGFLYLAVYLFSAAAVSFISYNADLKYTMSTPALHNYWKGYFISTSSFGGFMTTFWEGLRNIFIKWFWKTPPYTWIMTIFMPFALYYIVRDGIKWFKTDKGLVVALDTITAVLLTALFIAGILQVYPFTAARVTLFIAPFIFYSIIKSIEAFKEKFFKIYAVLSGVFIFTLVAVSVRIISG